MKVFVDTAAWIALINQRDALHNPALEISKNLRQQQVSLVTTEFVLLEVADGLCNLPTRRKTINFIDGLYQLPKLQIIGLDKTLFDAGWRLYKQRLDKEWSLGDKGVANIVGLVRYEYNSAITWEETQSCF